MPTSVLRRYTPPTCTLEIAAAGSALSRWTDRTVLKNLRFQLHFDDPKLPPEKQVTVHGDRTQLEALSDAVGLYVQSLLNQLPGEPTLLGPALDSPENVPAATKMTGIQLQPQGLLSHTLCLGSLANEDSGANVHLSALQLFDLANALDEYSSEAMSLPALKHSSWFQPSKGWLKAAAVMVLALGATGAIVKFIADVSTPVHIASAPSPTSDPALAGIPEPEPIGRSPRALKLEPVPSLPPTGIVKNPLPATPPSPITAPPVTAKPQNPVGSPVLVPGAAAQAGQLFAVPPQSGQPTTVAQAPRSSGMAPASQFELARSYALAPMSLGNQPSADTASASSAAAPAQQAPTAAAGVSETQIATGNTMFNPIPQVSEVRQYFQQKWQPPDGLNQPLQYSLVLNADGSIQRIVPLGVASEVYVDRTNMPLMGEHFVSAIAGGGNPHIRVVLNPDGKVQVFQEGN